MPYDVDTKPGAWVEAQAQRRLIHLLVAATLFGVVGVLGAVALHDLVLELLILGVVVATGIAAYDRMELAVPWLKGASAEFAVGTELDALRRDGYLVMHDVMFGGEGNLDHIVSGSNGVFLIETKFRRYELHELTKVKRQAARLHDTLGHWVTPIVCAGERKAPYRHHKVWIAGRGQLAELIRGIDGKPIDPESFYRFSDGLA